MIQEIINYLKEAYIINPIWQIVWFIGFIFSVIAFSNKNDKQTKILHSVSLLFWIVHFFLMWLYIASAVFFVWIFRNLFSIKYKWSTKIMIFFIFMYLIFWFFTFKNIYSILPLTAGILVNFAFFKLEWIKLRFTILFGSFLWITFNFLGHSLWWIAVEMFIEISLMITIFRLYFDKKIK